MVFYSKQFPKASSNPATIFLLLETLFPLLRMSGDLVHTNNPVPLKATRGPTCRDAGTCALNELYARADPTVRLVYAAKDE